MTTPGPNPFEASSVPITPAPASSDETARRAHLGAEAALRDIGSLWVLGGLLMFLGVATSGEVFTPFGLGIGGLAIAFGVVGFHLGRFAPWTRGPAALLGILGLLAVPFGTILSVYLFYLLGSAKGRFVLSGEYPDLVRRTPDVKRRTSPVVLFLVFLFVVSILAAIAIPSMRR